MKLFDAKIVLAALVLTASQAHAQSNNGSAQSQDKSLGQKLNDATTHTFSNGTTIQPNVSGRDKNVYDNPKDIGGTAGVKITY